MNKHKIRKIIPFLCILTMLVTMMPVQGFAESPSDISNHWAKAQIDDLMVCGYMSGYQDGTFKPDNPITRAEFMSIVNRAFHFTEMSEITYSDVKADAWYADIIKAAKQAGYIDGYSDGTIRPNNNITRQEAACVIAKIKQLKENAASVQGVKDAAKLPDWSKGAIGAVLEAKIMSGYPDGTFRAQNRITRAEAAVMLYKASGTEVYKSSGTYGPESGVKTVSGDVSLYADGITLQNMVIEGDLLLAEEIGEGNITLKNVTVKGTTEIKGGGENSIIVIDSTLGKVSITKENGKIRIVVSGNTSVEQVTANSGVKMEEKDLAGNATGFKEIVIDADKEDKIILVGSFEEVRVGSEGVTVDIPESTVIQTMILDKPAAVTGTGSIRLAQVNSSGVSFEKTPVKTETASGVTPPVQSNTGGSGGSSHHRNYADTVFKNGYIYSVNSIYTVASNVSQAVAIDNGVISYVGSDAGASAYIGPSTTVIDLKGKMVLPGFADSHAHAKAMAANIFDLSLYSAQTPEETIELIQDFYDANNPSYITGNGWNTLQESEFNKSQLDAITTQIPIVLYDSSHHIAWANSKAISLAGITNDTPNPPGGVIVKEGGELTGMFHEDSAIGLVMKAIPDNTVEQYKTGILEYQAMANSYGLTLNQDPQLSPNAIQAYEELAKAGMLTMRFRGGYLASPVIADDGAHFASLSDAAAVLDSFAESCSDKHEVADLFRMNSVKIYEDGGGPTTYMKGGPDYNVWPQDQLEYLCDKLEKNGVQIHCHAMGDAALAKLLDAFQYAKDQGGTALRNSITHLQFVDDGSGESDDIQRMADLGVIGIPQPFWMIKDSYYTMYWPFCGEGRTSECYPMKSLVDKGVIMAGGSDWPVTQPNAPLVSIQSGVTRILSYDDPAIAYTADMARNPMYRYPLGPISDPTKDCVDLKTMIQSVTINGAYATFLEDVTGSIEVGKSADLVVLDKNLFEVAPADIGKTNVMMTVFKGNIVYQSGLTVSDQKVVVYKSEPSAANGFTAPFMLFVANGTDGQKLRDSLNPPMAGSIEITDTAVVATPSTGPAITYGITMLPAKISNSFTVSDVTDQGCTITLDTAIAGLSADDIYLLRDSNKVSAYITSVTTSDGGKTYTITAKDFDSDANLITLNGKHLVYVYSPYHPPYIPAADHDFSGSQGQEINP